MKTLFGWTKDNTEFLETKSTNHQRLAIEAMKKRQKGAKEIEKQVKKVKGSQLSSPLYHIYHTLILYIIHFHIYTLYMYTRILLNSGGEEEIRTLESLLSPTPLAGERLRPLGHLSKERHKWYQQKVQDIFDFFPKYLNFFPYIDFIENKN